MTVPPPPSQRRLGSINTAAPHGFRVKPGMTLHPPVIPDLIRDPARLASPLGSGSGVGRHRCPLLFPLLLCASAVKNRHPGLDPGSSKTRLATGFRLGGGMTARLFPLRLRGLETAPTWCAFAVGDRSYMVCLRGRRPLLRGAASRMGIRSYKAHPPVGGESFPRTGSSIHILPREAA